MTGKLRKVETLELCATEAYLVDLGTEPNHLLFHKAQPGTFLPCFLAVGQRQIPEQSHFNTTEYVS